MEKKRVFVCGAGSIGIFLGAKLHSKNHEVLLFGRKKLENAGEKIFINNRIFLLPKRLFSAPKNQSFDFVFITSKLYDFDKMIRLINKKKIQGKILANIQNGLIDAERYKKILGNKKLVPICVFGGFRIEKDKLASFPTDIGWITESSKEGREISKIVSGCGIKCRPDRNFEALRVEKMIVNCCLNALSAIEKKPFKALLSKKRTKERIMRIFDECYKILSRKYILDDPDKMKRKMFKTWSNINHYSSTYQDIKSGRKNEVKFFNGYIVELGRKHKLSTEHNKRIIFDINKISNK